MALADWFAAKGISWHEHQRDGVHRAKRDRTGWREIGSGTCLRRKTIRIGRGSSPRLPGIWVAGIVAGIAGPR